jgi:hypothetical protein
MEVNDKLSGLLRDRWIMSRGVLNQSLPLILHEELYEHFGEWCQIIEANVYDTIDNAEVVIENRSGDRTQVQFGHLTWKRNRDLVDAVCQKTLTQLIVEGP